MKKDKFSKTPVFWITGFATLIWFVLRSGTSPRRLTYPCQQAAFPVASAFLIALAGVFSGLMITSRFKNISKITLGIVFLSIFNISSVTKENSVKELALLPEWQVNNPVSKVFVTDNVYPTGGSLAAGDNSVPQANFDDPTMDSLFAICASNGLNLYKNTEHPNGIVGNCDVVIIKPNLQWQYRLGTNTDRIKGLINLILQHPDGFSGEILICENTQELSEMSEENCNSDDTEQSIFDVVNAFQAKGHPVYIYDWNDIRENAVAEYSGGDINDGYIFQDDKVNYPKFQSPSGDNYISLRYGVWDNSTQQYDHDRLTIINFPVLKAHCMAGATIGIKNWIGVLSTANNDALYGGWDPMHYNYFWSDYALVARVMAVTAPKLTIVDASYAATRTNWEQPPDNTVIKTDKMVVSCDPLAASWYAAKFILTPIADYPAYTNPDNLSDFDPEHTYGLIIRRWANYLIDSAHISYTIDSSKISVIKSAGVDTSPVNPPVTTKIQNTYGNESLVFPNPNQGKFTIKVPEITDKAMVTILTMDGKQVYKQNINMYDNCVNINTSLKPGNYIINVWLKNSYYKSFVMVTK